MTAELSPTDPETALAVAYAPAGARAALSALFALDDRLRVIVATAREPGLALIRLIWWRDALDALDTAPPPAEPLLAALAAARLPGAAMAAMVLGWEALVDDPALGDETVDRHVDVRGGGLFALAGDVLGGAASDAERVRQTGAAWARVDLVRSGLAHRAGGARRAAAMLRRAEIPRARWPRTLRPLGQFGMLARRDAKRGIDALEPVGARARLARIALFHVSGR